MKRKKYEYYSSLFDGIETYKENQTIIWPGKRKEISFDDIYFSIYPLWVYLYHELESISYWTAEKIIGNTVTVDGRRLIAERKKDFRYAYFDEIHKYRFRV